MRLSQYPVQLEYELDSNVVIQVILVTVFTSAILRLSQYPVQLEYELDSNVVFLVIFVIPHGIYQCNIETVAVPCSARV